METKKVPDLRFNGHSNDWDKPKLENIADKVTEKNQNMKIREVFTNSAEYGIINQREYFDHDVAKKEHINTYYVVRPEDFVYNPRIFNCCTCWTC